MQLDNLVAAAAAGTADLLRDVPARLLDAPTPCREWTVRTLINHLVQVGVALELAGRGVPADHWTTSFPPGRFDPAAAAAPWTAPPPAVRMGDHEMPGPMIGTMLAADLVLHGWDLARAVGRDVTWAPELAEATHTFLVQTGEQGRAMGLFAEPVPVPADAPVFDRALGLSGRDPAWRPSAARQPAS
jgi:uncharacterized protein (TIGR03086 family)